MQQDEARALWASGKMMLLMVRIARTTHQRIDRLVFLFLSFERGKREKKREVSPVALFSCLLGWLAGRCGCMIQGAAVKRLLFSCRGPHADVGEKEKKPENAYSHVLKDKRQTKVKQSLVLRIQQKEKITTKKGRVFLQAIGVRIMPSHIFTRRVRAGALCGRCERSVNSLGRGGNWRGWRGKVGEGASRVSVCRAGYRACERKGRRWCEGVQSTSFLDATWWY